MAPGIAPTPALRPDDQLDALARWEAHVSAGRIGRPLPTDPAVAANRDASEALFRRFRGGAR